MKRTPARKAFALLLAVVLVLGLAAPAFAAEKVILSVQKLTVNGAAVECEKYNIDGYNYFKLRDLAELLNGTASQFNVDYDKEAKLMVVTTGAPYTTPNGTELQSGVDNSATARPTPQTLVVDGETVENVTAYNIGGSNFFQLRELGKTLGFYVHYDQETNTAIVDAADEDEDFTTGDASLDDPRNADKIGSRELLVVSFGTSFNDSRRETIGAIENAMEEAFPELSVRRGFTANIVIDHIYKRDDVKIDDLKEALDRAAANGVKELYVQPTHLMDGYEYNDVVETVADYEYKFDKVVIGRPVLDTEADYDVVIKAITAATKAYDDGETAIVFMGHGTEAESNHVYADMQAKLTAKGYDNYFVGTVEAKPSVFDVLEAVKAGGYKKVVLRPLMIVAGDHAHNDMADPEDENSWYSVFTSMGFEVECVLEGLGQLPAIQDLLVDHMQAAMEAAESGEEEDEENYYTGDASLDNPRNQDGMGYTELLVVSFGTSFNDSRRETIGAIEEAMEKAFPGYDVRRGFTAQIVIDHIQKRDGEVIDNLTQALDRAVANGVTDLLVQPTHLMDGFEYNDVKTELEAYKDKFDHIVLGAPLLTSEEDYDIVIKAITEATAEFAADPETAVVFMGHGTEAESNHVYADMQAKLTEKGFANYFVGTVEAEPDVYDVLEAVQASGYKKVVLRPLMIVAGDHANNDMADPEDEGSWYSIFTDAGFEVECVLEGLGQLPAIQDLLVDHIRTAAAEALEEDYDTGDAGLDDPRNADDIGEKELLVISFGTSFNDSRVATIGAIESAMEEAFPELSVRRGFTADIVINHIARRDGEIIDNVARALDRAVENGVKELYVQPTHLMDGFEYNDVVEAVNAYADKFEKIVIGRPILDTDADYDVVIKAITEATADYAADPETAVVFMGHGTEAESNHVYADMQAKLTAAGYANYFVGTVEAKPSVFDVLEAVQAGGYKKVVLRPLMIVAGDHANNDMADPEDEGSWYSVFTAAGFEVECVLEGLGQLPAIQDLLADHMKAAMEAAEAPEEGEEEEDEENYETGDASLDDPRNQDEIGEKELLVVSFGTSYNDSRRETIGAIEKAMEEAFPELSVRRGFTAQIVIDHIQKRDGEVIDNLTQALDRAVANGVKELYVQPTHLMDGFEYNDVLKELENYADKFEKIVVGKPILDTDADYDAVIKAITDATAAYAADEKTAVVFMGHGTEADSNHVYADMQAKLTAAGYANYFVGTVEAEPDVFDVLEAVKAGGYEKVVLRPLMIVAGDHANNDMADPEDPDSWYSVFTDAGFEVECVLEGLGQLPAIQNLLVDHMKAAMEAAEAPEEEEEDEENYETGDASLDDPRNADEIGEKELLVVSFGTSFNDSRRLTIGAIEKAMENAKPGYAVRRAFTAQIVIDHIQKRDGEVIDNLTQALERAVANGVKNLVVQPTHLMDGFEYNDVKNELLTYVDKFDSIKLGKPVLTTEEDYDAVITAITDATAEFAADPKTAIVFMGHGTEAESNHVYADMQAKLTDKGFTNYFVGTVEAKPSVFDVLEAVQAGGYEQVVLRPLMIVAGDHANNDMADPEDEGSWYSVFKAAGFEVECVLEGLGQLEPIQKLLVDHARDAMLLVPTRDVAGSGDMTAVDDVKEEGMTPVAGDAIEDGSYKVEVKSSSSMFKVNNALLTVKEGKMSLTFSTTSSYTWMFMGSTEEIADADLSEFQEGVVTDEGMTYTIPVEALDDGIVCAAYSKNKDQWYARTLLVRYDSLEKIA